MKLLAPALFLSLILLVPHVAAAKSVIYNGETVSVTNEQAIEKDFYAWGNQVSMSGEVLGDMYALAGQVAVNGDVQSDLVIFGGNAQVYGTVQDDVRVLGGETVIAGEVAGDVFVIGGTLNILSTASIKGDVTFYGGELIFEGVADGDVQGTMENARIDGTVGGINLTTNTLTLGDKAVVKNAIQYKSANDIVRSPNATIEGDVLKNAPTDNTEKSWSIKPFIFVFLMLVVSGLVVLFAFRKALRRLLKPVGKYQFDILLGLGYIFLLPLVAVLAVVSGLLLPIGVALFFFYVASIAFAVIVAAIYLGHAIFRLLKKPSPLNGVETILGALVLSVALAVPVLGFLLAFGAVAATLGLILRKAFPLLQ